MFITPNTAVPQAKIDAATVLETSNDLLRNLQDKQREAFRFFWYPNGQLRSKEDVNAILASMDEASPGQSAKFFVAAKALADLILSMAPGSLGDDDWTPPYEYTIDPQTYSLRVI